MQNETDKLAKLQIDYERECCERNKTHELLQQKENGNLCIFVTTNQGGRIQEKKLCNKNQVFVQS